MEYALLSLILFGVLFYGNAILGRFPKGAAPKAYDYGNGDFHLTFRSTGFREKQFKVGFVSYWEIGNEFEIFGDIRDCRDGEADFDIGGAAKIRVSVIPYGEWFDDNTIGRKSYVADGVLKCVLHLPYLVARQMLDQIRAQPEREVWIQGKCLENSSGTVIFHQITIE